MTLRLISTLLLCSLTTSAAPLASFEAPNVLTGKTTKISYADASKGTVVVFLSAKCPCSSSHEAPLKELAKEYAKEGFQFVALNSNANEEVKDVKAHFASSDLPFPVLRDDGSKIADKLEAMKTPHVFVIDPKGLVVFQGGVDDSSDAARAKKFYLKDTLAALKAGKTPELKTARALGCYITRPGDI